MMGEVFGPLEVARTAQFLLLIVSLVITLGTMQSVRRVGPVSTEKAVLVMAQLLLLVSTFLPLALLFFDPEDVGARDVLRAILIRPPVILAQLAIWWLIRRSEDT